MNIVKTEKISFLKKQKTTVISNPEYLEYKKENIPQELISNINDNIQLYIKSKDKDIKYYIINHLDHITVTEQIFSQLIDWMLEANSNSYVAINLSNYIVNLTESNRLFTKYIVDNDKLNNLLYIAEAENCSELYSNFFWIMAHVILDYPNETKNLLNETNLIDICKENNSLLEKLIANLRIMMACIVCKVIKFY